MNKVITISLNGHPYQLEEAGYDALRAYLDQARLRLAENPDREEIVRDLEQAIGDKLRRFLNAHKTVSTAEEVATALSEMGPVDPATGSGQAGETKTAGAGTAGSPKKLYRIKEGGMIFGVANGLGAYLDVDVTLIRVIFVILGFITSGGFFLAYFIMGVIIPTADTPEKRAQASGAPFSAQDVIDRAQEGYRNFSAWHRIHKAEQYRWKAEAKRMKWEARAYAHSYRHPSVIGQLMQLAFFALMLWAIYTYLPGTRPFFDAIGRDVSQAWQWLALKLNH